MIYTKLKEKINSLIPSTYFITIPVTIQVENYCHQDPKTPRTILRRVLKDTNAL